MNVHNITGIKYRRKAGYTDGVMNRIPISIIHVLGFLLSVLFSVAIFAKTAVIGANGGLNTIAALLHFKHENMIRCEATKIDMLPTTSEGKSASYSCDQVSCVISVSMGPDKQLIKSFKAINNDAISIIDINNFFFDENREILSYSTTTNDVSSRIVMNFDGELLQSIDETPGENRMLVLLGYQPTTGMLVYKDTQSNDDYFYSVDSIYFARRRCP